MIKNWCPKYIKNSQSSTEKSAWGGGDRYIRSAVGAVLDTPDGH